MKRPSKLRRWQYRAAVFGLAPCMLGLGAAQLLRWNDVVWLTDAGVFWPFTLSAISTAILVKLALSPFEDATSAVTGWLTLLLTWFYAPMWATGVEVPATAAVVGRDGHVHLARQATRCTECPIWLLTDRPGSRTVHNVSGKFAASGLELSYSYSPAFIATRRHRDDLRRPLADAAGEIVSQLAKGSRTSRIALLESRSAQQELFARICRSVAGDGMACPLTMGLAPSRDAAVPGGLWSTQHSEEEAIAEKHLPSLVRMLTEPDAALARRDQVLALFLDLVSGEPPLAHVARKSHLLDDAQFDQVIARVLEAGSGDLAATVVGVNRLSETQRKALRELVLDQAAISTIVENAAAIRMTDAEVVRLAARMRPTLLAEPAVAVRVLHILGDRLPRETQHEAVAAIVRARASYALSAIRGLNFRPELRRALLQKIIADASVDDFAAERLSKETLLQALTPSELRAVIAMAVARSESSEKWQQFVLEILPVRDMTPAERRTLLDGLLFKSAKDALEFVSKSKDHLDPSEVDEVTRDYTRTITPDLCLHLSHRNDNRRTNYFSSGQLQIFRDCAERGG